MYLHLGEEYSVSLNDVIGIFDLENTSIGKGTREFLKEETKNGRVINVSMEMPKSFIVCKRADGAEMTYISQLAASTLFKRYKRKSI